MGKLLVVVVSLMDETLGLLIISCSFASNGVVGGVGEYESVPKATLVDRNVSSINFFFVPLLEKINSYWGFRSALSYKACTRGMEEG